MPWVCPFCGKENYQDDRIALKEPECRTCGEARTTPDGAREIISKRSAALKKEIKEKEDRIDAKHSRISSLQNEILELEQEIRVIREDMGVIIDDKDDNEQELAKLERIIICTEPARHLAPTQALLQVFA